MSNLYKFNQDSTIDEYGVDHSDFSVRDEIEYNKMRIQEKEQQLQKPWYRQTYDKVYNEANKLKDEPLYDKYKH